MSELSTEQFDEERQKYREQRDIWDREEACRFLGEPFELTPQEQAVLDRIEREREARMSAAPTKAEKERWEAEEMARGLENGLAQLKINQIRNAERFGEDSLHARAGLDGIARIEARIKELRAA